ncbi:MULTISPECIES: DUF4231 domain-containing protein [unclassified Dietzia]|uniref:DUF4231 domain-containing protein n=1 Tax=unclassified Dietzia TaxID=2617939 RepID=UPI0015FDB880|nr:MULTISPECIES: DUF4231 domain-containing protein [unclassified Dietzia]MBB1023368.1 DUF4231 domain-containing protein [Dietzia sp. DQ12-76]MBB1027236.1 DUF4231 domain-containing protein [Dietzia sp. DQ11-38-2]
MLTFPAAYLAFDNSSAKAQTLFNRVRRGELVCLVIASAAAVIPGRAAAVLAVLFFLAALFLRASNTSSEAEKRWYQARAAAESVKSMSWQYAVGGESFRLSQGDVDEAFRARLLKIANELDSIDVGPPNGSVGAITPEMRRLRSGSISVRHDFYIDNRVRDQKNWYSAKAELNRKRASQWRVAIVSLEALAVLLGMARILEFFDADLLGVLAAAAAGCAAWFQMRNYAGLSVAYALTAHEIDILDGSYVDGNDEQAWAQFVHDAEAAFSREHTMWLARKQGPIG